MQTPTNPPQMGMQNGVESADWAQVAVLIGEQSRGAIFGYSNRLTAPLLSALRDLNVNVTSTTNHVEACTAATTFAEMSGDLAICIVGGRDGACATAHLRWANLRSLPVLVVCVQVASPLTGTGDDDESALLEFATGMSKHAFRATSSAEARAMIEAGVTLATTGRPGVAAVEIPQNLARSAASDTAVQSAFQAVGAELLRGYERPPSPSITDVAGVLEQVREAKRPVLLFGGGVVASAAPWKRIAKRLRLPVALTSQSRGAFAETSPQCVGPVGPSGRRSAAHALRRADLIVACGTSMSQYGAGSSADPETVKVVQIDVDPFELGRRFPIISSLHADARIAADSLLDAMGDWEPTRDHAAWVNECAAAAALSNRPLASSGQSLPSARFVFERLDAALQADDTTIVDAGPLEHVAAKHLRPTRSRSLVVRHNTTAPGTLPGVLLGAAAARPNYRVVVVTTTERLRAGSAIQRGATERPGPTSLVVLCHDDEDALAAARLAAAIGIEALKPVQSSDQLDDGIEQLLNERADRVLPVILNEELVGLPDWEIVAKNAQRYSDEEKQLLRDAAWGRVDDSP